MRTGTGAALVLFLAAGIGCASYQQTSAATKNVWSVRIAKSRAEVENCRHLGLVDANDSSRGCGLTAQPSTLECLRYQVALAGGDTLFDRGLVGDAYDCSGRAAASATPSPVAPPPSTPAPAPGSAEPAPSPATARSAMTPSPVTETPLAPTPPPTAIATPTPTAPAANVGVRIVESRSALKGCVYLDEIDLKAECPSAAGVSSMDCVVDRASRMGGNAVLIEANRALVFSCKNGR
ncbi:MAG: hypothetical protein ACM3SU_11585 [Acidobacteriota bacterium]